jgi:UDP:flavonoid glycosyltransferase YjiC (YdhE family)
MRITIIALGSRGDIQPLVPLGKALKRAGHTVRVATFEAFSPLITDAGLDFFQLRGDAKALLNTAMEHRLLDGRSNAFQYINAIRKSYAKLAETLADDLSDPSLRDSELILNQLPGNIYGDDLGEYLGVPVAIVAVIPMMPTRSRPMLGFPPIFTRLPGYNLMTYLAGEQLVWQMFRKAINRWRTDSLGLSRKPLLGRFKSTYRGGVTVINGFSPHVVPRPSDWGDEIHITGWWYPEDRSWKPSENLERFLDAGDRPMFIGFGSIPVQNPRGITDLLVEAVQSCGRRAILHAGWAGLGGTLPSEFFSLDYAPYDWLFSRMAALVHHGGSGTSGFGFKSGVPSLIVPFGFDQYFWGDRAKSLGVGPDPLSFSELTAKELAERIDLALTDPEISRRANDLGLMIQNENGVEKAVGIIETI